MASFPPPARYLKALLCKESRMKHLFLAAIALIAFTPAAFAQTGQNGAQYGDPNNAMAEGSQNANGALSGQTPGVPGDITSGSSETHSYSGADLDQNTNGAMSLQSNGSLNNESNLSANPPGTP
jgi:hypothetical protein